MMINRFFLFTMMGYLYIILSCVFFCMMTIFVKKSGDSLDTMQIVFARGVFTLVFTIFILWKKNIYIWGSNKKLLGMRGLIGTIALFFVYESLQRFSLAEAVAIQYLHPIFAAIFAMILIYEKIGKILYVSMLLALLGTYYILEFPFYNNVNIFEKIDILIAFAGSILTGLAYVLVRSLAKLDESPYVIMFYFPLFTVPISFLFVYDKWINPELDIWIYLILVGICAQTAQYFLTHGYKLLSASRASLTSYTQIPLSVVAGYYFFGDKISYNFLFGSLLILLSVILMMRNMDQSNYNLKY